MPLIGGPVGRHDWYRNKEWDDTIALAFAARLGRTREKHQYLRIQASCLTDSHPRVAVELLDQYFALGEHFDHAQALVERAHAHLALGDILTAVAGYEAALAREALYPHVLTEAYLELPLLIALRLLEDQYSRALGILDANRFRLASASALPIDRYRWHGARALILHQLGQEVAAKADAVLAMLAASEKHPGLRKHPRIGLVKQVDDDFGRRIASVAG